MADILVLLLVFMIIAAVIALGTRDLLSAVISLGAVGFGSSVAFVILRAPDVAIAQIVVEVLCLVILIRATVWRDVHTVEGTRNVYSMAVSGALVLVVLTFGIVVMSQMPPFGSPVPGRVPDAPSITYLNTGQQDTGAANIVGAILLDFRGYDTLGEATVLFTAIIGAAALLRRKSRAAQSFRE